MQLTFKHKVQRRHRSSRIHADGSRYTSVHTTAQLVCMGLWCSYNQLRVSIGLVAQLEWCGARLLIEWE